MVVYSFFVHDLLIILYTEHAHTHTNTHTYISKREARKRKYQAKSTEELELEKIKELRKEARKKMKLSRRSFMNLSKTFEPVQIKNSRPPTETKEFKFSKEKPRASSQEEDSINPAKFPMTLRSSEKNKVGP